MGNRFDRTVSAVASNVGAVAAGGVLAVGSGLPLLARILTAPLAGTAGYLVCGWLVGVAVRTARRARVSRAGSLVYDLKRLPAGEAAGGKASGLARLSQSGFPVPAGLVILPRAFDGDDLTAAGERALAAGLSRLRAERFAVRSSALAEDSAQSSFAGGFESVLDVEPEQLVEAIRTVRRSGRAERVSAYAAARGVTGAPQVAVVVQRMLSPEVAGVLFTADPLSGDLSTMVGNLVTGRGERLVSGEANAEEFRLARPAGTYSGPPVLSRRLAARLHETAHDAEATLGGTAQDIEWAVAGGRVWLLQARPVTTLNGWDPVTAERNDSLTGTCLWSATNLTEANPEPQTPLTVSMVRYQQESGGPSMKLRGREMAGYIGGRPYANLTVQVSVRGPRAAADPHATYAQLAGLWGELPPTVPIPVLPMTRADWQDEGLRLLASLVRLQRARKNVPAFLRTSREDCARLAARIDAAATAGELLGLWEREVLPASLRSFWSVIAVTDDRVDPVVAQLRDLVGAEDAAVLLGNLSGLAGNLESLGPAAGLQEVLAGRLSRQEYADRFGHRGHNEAELAWPRPSEDPGWLDAALAAAAGGGDIAAARARQQAAFDAALKRLRTSAPGRAPRIERQLRRRAAHAARREAVRSEAVRWTGLGRRFALRAGHLLGIGDDVFLLTVEELLAALAGDTAAYAHLEARRQLLERYRALPPLPAFILGRFDPFAWADGPGRGAGQLVAGASLVQDASPEPGDPDVITGAAGSLGVAEGRVRRLDGLEQALDLRAGEVLVTHLTNIGWTPVFPRAAAIVTDLGAPLSHAAIVARELGLPAVLGCGDATARLATGDLVRVDGAAGTVRVLARAPQRPASGDTLEHVFDSVGPRG